MAPGHAPRRCPAPYPAGPAPGAPRLLPPVAAAALRWGAALRRCEARSRCQRGCLPPSLPPSPLLAFPFPSRPFHPRPASPGAAPPEAQHGKPKPARSLPARRAPQPPGAALVPLRCGPRGARRGPGRAGAILGRSAASQPPRGARSAGAGPRGLLPAGCRGSARGGVAGRARSARTGPPGWAAGAGPPPPPLRLRPAGLGPALRRLPGGAERPPLGCPRASAPSLAPSRRLAAGPARGWELGAWLPRQRCPSLGGAYGSSRHAGQRWLLGFCSALNPPPPFFFFIS